MTVRYGDQWLRKWEGVPAADLKEDWATQLAWLWKRPEAIAFALENLPADAPPNVAQFKAIATRLPDAPQQPRRLEAPDPTPEQLERRERLRLKTREVAERLRANAAAGPVALNKLRARELAGEKLTPGQRGYLAAAESLSEPTEEWLFDAFKPIPRDILPDGIRRDSATRAFWEEIEQRRMARTTTHQKPAE